ncbi:TPA: hypothetical protein I8271_001996 [Kluyvera intermedia]|uniref:Lipoprotein n=2 Tax=Enterobacteriaceae TaxID=543 RepID=A0AAC8QLW4_9ENTR|nr:MULTISPECIES: hypothetical protein [Enterobacteriaceae]HAT2204944.1 hypothetical protein [Kluyvera intermedia]AKL11201.1 hypothetical protein AB182_07685 [Phytobacter ursingii]MCL9670101.1 hypothetical protein [Citrobacter sp. MNAZ 1397]HAT2515505.1 hypothetical protein [Kluyvera intermedia]HAT2603262.1 hypothetical protein [Kluyvera intermedia]
MKRILTVMLGVGMCAGALADSGSPQLKVESQRLIRESGHECNKVEGVYPAAFGGSLIVICDDTRRYTIKSKDGHYVVGVAE